MQNNAASSEAEFSDSKRKSPKMRYAIVLTALLITGCTADNPVSGPLGYESTANSFASLEVAKKVALDNNKKILIIAGADQRINTGLQY